MVVAAGQAAGLELVEECVALMAGVRDGVLVPRASFFQIKNVRDAIADGDPQWIPQHEDVIVLRSRLGESHDHRRHAARIYTDPTVTPPGHRLDASTPAGVDRRAHPAHPANADPGHGSATDPRPDPGRDVERKPDPCPPYTHPTPGDVRPDTTTHRQPTGPARPHQQAGPFDPASRR
jgi:hypothetical protein